MTCKIKNEKGIALLIALMLTIMLTIVGLGIVTSSNDEVTIAGNELNEMRAFYAAESGLDKATASIQSHYEATGVPPTSGFPSDTVDINGVTMMYYITADTMRIRRLTKSSLSGLNAYVRPHKIVATAIDMSHETAYTLEQSFEVAFVPVFQFGVFYENDLEIAPGPAMTLFGRVHSNQDIYIQSDNSLHIDSYITAFGDILHGRKSGSGMSTGGGDVSIKAMDGNYYSMYNGSDWLDANDSYWYDTSSARWGGRVQDAAFGQEYLGLPLASGSTDAHKIIERVSGNPDSYENKASLKFIDGQAFYDVAGTWTNVTASLTAAGAITETSFYDKREGQNANVVDIDMSVLKTTTYMPTNGIVYLSDQRSGLRGMRLNNADDVGRPISFFSENPVYTKGDINTINKQPMAIIADALTILSDNWSDNPAFAANSDKTVRPAIGTDANFCFITGNKETGAGGSAYNGGLENLPRFLENWSGDTYKFRGSIVNLWLSQQTNGDWDGSYYTPPNRDWAFDPDLDDPANMPPGTPMVRSFVRWGWKQLDVGYGVKEYRDYIAAETE